MTGGFRVVAEQRFRCQIREGGFSFCFIHHGEEALATLAVEADIDLMLLDFNIPVMDGLTLLSPAFVKSRRRSRRSSSRPMAKPPNFQTPLWCATHYCGRQSATGGEIAEIVARLEDRGQHPLRGRNELVRISARPDQSVEH